MKNKRNFLVIIMSLILCLQGMGVAYAQDNNIQDNNIYERQDDIFETQKTLRGTDSLNLVENIELKEKYSRIAKENNFNIISTTKKTVYVQEKLDKNKNVVESKLMNKKEVELYQERKLYSKSLGDDSESYGKLDIYLVVYEDSNHVYRCYGNADWDIEFSWSGETVPATGKDFIAFTWGGDGELKQKSKSFSGKYDLGGNIPYSKEKSDSYRGYCWQFDELNYNPHILDGADYIDTYVKLQKTYSRFKNKETNVKLTYIHTYTTVNGSVSFGASESGLACGVSLSSCPKQWQIEIDVSGLKY